MGVISPGKTGDWSSDVCSSDLFPQVKLENILSHPALNTSGVERHMQLKLAVCVCAS